MSLTVLDLFAGCGGLSLGFELAGASILGAVEIDQWAADTYRRNFPAHRMMQEDIRSIPRSFWLKEYRHSVDMVIGGPPCQGFSVSGKRQYGVVSEKNNLVASFLDVVEIVDPPVVLMENVLGFTTGRLTRSQRVMEFTKKRLADLGYAVTHAVLDAPDYGVPSLRRRVFILATKCYSSSALFRTGSANREMRGAAEKRVTCWEAISDLPELEAGQAWEPERGYASSAVNAYQDTMRGNSTEVHNHVAMNHTPRVVERFRQIRPGESAFKLGERNGDGEITVYKSNNQRLRKDQVALCITANFQSNYVHPIQHRNLTAREAARLMSFPDTFVFQGKRTQMSSKFLKKYGREHEDYLSQYNQIGNAVPPLMAKAIAAHLMDSVDLEKEADYWGAEGQVLELEFKEGGSAR